MFSYYSIHRFLNKFGAITEQITVACVYIVQRHSLVMLNCSLFSIVICEYVKHCNSIFTASSSHLLQRVLESSLLSLHAVTGDIETVITLQQYFGKAAANMI